MTGWCASCNNVGLEASTPSLFAGRHKERAQKLHNVHTTPDNVYAIQSPAPAILAAQTTQPHTTSYRMA